MSMPVSFIHSGNSELKTVWTMESYFVCVLPTTSGTIFS